MSIAQDFVDLAMKYDWRETEKIEDQEIQVIFDTVDAAGFNPGQIVPGKLVYQGTNPCVINEYFKFQVIRRNKPHYFATGWADCAVRRVVFGSKKKESHNRLVEVISQEIENSIPLLPIQITPEKDMLREPNPKMPLIGFRYFVKHTREDDIISTGCVGVHENCNGIIQRVSETMICCTKCGLKVLIPISVRTYGDLRYALNYVSVH